MAITHAREKKIGRELVEWIYLGIRTGARRRVAEYQKLKASKPAEAEEFLKMACNMPRRARARVNEFISRYDIANGPGSAQVFLGQCLLRSGTVTLGEIYSELTALENYAQGLIDAKIASTMTLDEIAADIESKVAWEAQDWQFPFPANYVDLW